MAQENSFAERDTIYALSSGTPPAAVAIVRISGPDAASALVALAGSLPKPRQATLRTLRDVDGDMLDRTLILWFPAPRTVTGDDLAELHLHGGRAVVAAVLNDLKKRKYRLAEPGEFTRRALLNGKLSLNEVEGLADLLEAETESQRREALRRATGALSRKIDDWTERLLSIAAQIEAAIDYDGEDGETVIATTTITEEINILLGEIEHLLTVPPVERLRDGIRVAISGPPNAGKSTLFNALVRSDAAIVSDRPGTTRDALERPISVDGIPLVLVDTAGIRETNDPIEQLGVGRARAQKQAADLVLSLEPMEDDDDRVISITSKIDVCDRRAGTIGVSAVSGDGMDDLLKLLIERCRGLVAGDGEVAVNRQSREILGKTAEELSAAADALDMVIIAEHVRHARVLLDKLTGQASVEDLLDSLFGRFCLGK